MKRNRFIAFILAVAMLAVSFTAAASATTPKLTEIYDLRVEDLVAPIGVDNPNPVFSWKMRSETVGAAQTAYRIVVSAGRTVYWDSGKVSASASTGIVYTGEALQAQTEYKWKLTVWDQNGSKLKTQASSFETGLMDASQWGDEIKWISVAEKTVTHYTYEVDVRGSVNNVSPIFGATDSYNFYMAQVKNSSGTSVLYRPHVRYGDSSSNKWVNEEVDLTASFGITVEDFTENGLHMMIDVTLTTITTYINGVQVHQWAVNENLPTTSIGQVGFRMTGSDAGYIDNIKITDYSASDEGELYALADFEDGVNLFAYGEVTEGELACICDGTQRICIAEPPRATHYTYEADVRATNNNVSPIFGAIDSNNFYMAQIKKNGTTSVLYKPHVRYSYNNTNGYKWENTEINLTTSFGITVQDLIDGLHMKIDVTLTTITTYINGVQVYQQATNANVPTTEIGQIGFRMTGTDKGYIDNIKITDYTTSDAGELYTLVDFEDGVNLFTSGEVTDGELACLGDSTEHICIAVPPRETHYTYEADVRATNNNISPIFGAIDSNNFYMAQIKNNSGTSVFYKPHVRYSYDNTNGYKWESATVDLTTSFGITVQDLLNGLHLKIDMTVTTITTYVNGVQVYQQAVNANVPITEIGQIGFRMTGTDEGYIDNIKITDYTTCDEGKTYALVDFKDGVNLFDAGTVENFELACIGDGTEYICIAEPPIAQTAASFRKDFAVGADLVSAKLYATALGVYDAFINGERIGRLAEDGSTLYDELKPGSTEAQLRKLYYTYDVTHLLNRGEANTISAWVTGGWWIGGIVSRTGGEQPAFAAKLVLSYDDGSQEILCTDESWSAAYEGPMLYGDIYNGETYDASASVAWMYPTYDITWPNAALNVEFTGEVEAHTGTTMRLREDLELSPVSIYVYDGITGAASDRYGTVTIDRTYTDGDVMVLEPGETMIIDLGQNHSGWEELVLSGNRGTVIQVRHAELLNDNEGLISRNMDGPEGSLVTSYLRNAAATTTYILAGDTQECYHPTMSYYGYRYLEITAGETITLYRVRGQVLTNVERDSGSLETSDAKVNQLISNIVWGQYSNYISVPTDCPQRDERYGWLADTQVFSMTAAYNSADTKAFLQKWLQDVRDNQKSTGEYRSVAPYGGSYGNNFGRTGWADAGIIVPYNMYLMFGDISILEEHYASMQLYIDVYLASTDKNGGDLGYGDWMAPGDNNDDTVKAILGVAYYAWDALLMSEMAEALGKTEDAARYLELYETEKAYFIEQFVNDDGSLISTRQTASLYALYLDLLPNDASRAIVRQALTDNIAENGYRLQTGFLGTPILLEVLSAEGMNELAYTLLLQEGNPSWLYTVNNGGTTLWERWDSYTLENGLISANRSMNHYAYGCVGEWMYSYMCGIQADEQAPGFQHFILAPQPNQMLDYATATYDSAYGTIVSAWQYDGSNLTYRMTVPANSSAEIRIPVETLEGLTVNGKAYTEVTQARDGIVFRCLEGDVAVFDAVAGSFVITTEEQDVCYLTIYTEGCDVIPAYISINGAEKTAVMPRIRLTPGETYTIEIFCANDVDYTAVGWTNAAGTVLSESACLTYTPGENEILTAHFDEGYWESLACGATVTATRASSTWDTTHLTDGVMNHLGGNKGWSSAKVTDLAETPVSVVIDLGAAQEFDMFRLYPRTDARGVSVPLCFPTSYVIEVSDDNSTWTQVYAVEDGEAVNWRPTVIQLDEVQTARYIRLTVSAVSQVDTAGNWYVQLSEFGVYYTGSSAAAEALTLTAEEPSTTAGDGTVTAMSAQGTSSGIDTLAVTAQDRNSDDRTRTTGYLLLCTAIAALTVCGIGLGFSQNRKILTHKKHKGKR